MALSSSSKPRRIPPSGPLPPPAPSPMSRRPEPIHPPAVNVPTGTSALQDHIDTLQAEFDQIKAQLRQAQKLASIGTTAAVIAHEFNNLFTPVVAYARQALDTDDVPLMRTALAKTLERTAAMTGMADRIIGLARHSDAAARPVPLRELAEEAVACLCRDLDRDNIGVNIQIDEHLEAVANENQLLQVLFNLVINARQAMLGTRGRLTIDAVRVPGDQVEINVRDTGCGIAPEHLARIFEPFFSTKRSADRPDRRGLGLGLPICKDIIEQHGGTITVTSKPRQGTTITLRLPAAG